VADIEKQEESREERLDRITVQLFRRGYGAEVLAHWVDNFVMVENLELDPAVEGARSFVLQLYEAVQGIHDKEESDNE
jgi:hypothetical protein